MPRASIFDRTAISDYALWLVTTNASSFLRFDVYDGGYKQIGTPVTLWGWHHAAIQKDAGSIVLFLDGQRVGTTNVTSVKTHTNPLIVGAAGTPYIQASTNYNFHGLIDELRFYDRTLSEAEIRALYAQGILSLRMEGSPLRVCWRSQTGLTYQVQYRASLTTGTWTAFGSPILGDGNWQCVPVDGAVPSRFYRMVISP